MLRLAQEMSSDIIIVDVAMPDLNGIEATRYIITKAPSIKALALSMYSDRRFVLGMLSSGAPHLKFRGIEAEYQRLPDSLLVHPSFILYLANHNTGTLSANRQRRTVRVI